MRESLRPATAVRAIATSLALSAAAFAVAQEPASLGFDVLLVSTLPSPQQQDLAQALKDGLRERAHGELLELQTFGDPAALAAHLESKASETKRPFAVVSVDAVAAQQWHEAAPREGAPPHFAVVANEDLLGSGHGEEGSLWWRLDTSTVVVETTPSAAPLVDFLRAEWGEDFPAVGFVFTHDFPPALTFQDALEAAMPGMVHSATDGGEGRLMRCLLDPGACRNLNDVKFALRKELSAMAPGSLLVVYPDANTTKFSFAFKQFAESHGYGLVSLGDFQTGGEVLEVKYDPSALSAAILESSRAYLETTPLEPLTFEKPAVAIRHDPEKWASLARSSETTEPPKVSQTAN
ncbi:MAG: hypothetical protein RLY93_02870 [Sumerlaeia bacterium]